MAHGRTGSHFRSWFQLRAVSIASLAAVFFLLSLTQSRGATFNIGNGDIGALRAAIAAANSNNQDDTINLATNGGYYIPDVDNNTGGANGLPVIDRDAASGPGHSLTINGNGATVARSFANGTPDFRILYISNGITINQHPATISNVTFTNAVANATTFTEGDGGAIYFAAGELTLNNCVFTANRASQHRGGAIFVATSVAFLVLNNCTLSNNNAHESGGAIQNFCPSVTLNNCTLNGNTTLLGPGGAIENFQSSGNNAVLTLTNCTLAGNSSTDSEGDAIINLTSTTSHGSSVQSNISNCTFSGNSVVNSYNYTGGVPSSAKVTVSNTIFFDSPLVNEFNPGSSTTIITSNGYNLSNDNGGGYLTSAGDQINLDPKLDPAGVKDNGGPTPTIALLNGSPAIDQGRNFGVTTDQRGLSRPYDLAGFGNAPGGDGSDIGAYETRDPIQNGASFTVNSTADHDDGVCGAVDCTLREAVAATNAASGAQTINLNVSGTIGAGALGQIVVSDSTTINGPGARQLAISGAGVSRVFNFSNGTSTLSGLTIRDGFVHGNAIVLNAFGGGLTNALGTLTVNDCAFVNNQAAGNPGASNGNNPGGAGLGGGVNNTFNGILNMNRCTFNGNLAQGGAGGANSGAATHGGDGGAGEGGALFSDSTGTINLTNCTFAGNTAGGGAGGNDSSFAGGNGGAGEGGGIYNRGTLNVISCTISNNFGLGGAGGTGSSAFNNGAAGVGRGGIVMNAGSATLSTTIVAANTGSGGGKDVDGTFASGGYNLIGTADHSTGLTGTGDQAGTDASPINAQLGAFGNFGGDTDNVSLNAGSLAIDHGNDATAPPRDQRNYLRTGRSDIGAFEYNGSLLRLVRVARNGEQFQVFIEVVKGKTYGLQRKDTLAAAQWSPIVGASIVAGGNDTEFVADNAAFTLYSSSFYEATAQ